MKKYISTYSLSDSIKYFESIDVKNPEQLGLLFFFKALGVSKTNSVYFSKSGDMNEEDKLHYKNVLHNMSAVFDKCEYGGKRTCLFPFSITKDVKHKSFYNGGSIFDSLLSRINDTVDNTLVDKFINKDAKGNLLLDSNYQKYAFDNFLNGSKISLTHFAVWVCRFIEFDVKEDLDNKKFTKMCVNATKDICNLDDTDISYMFFDDSKYNEIQPSDEVLTGIKLRKLISFSDLPEVSTNNDRDNSTYSKVFSMKETSRLMEGDSINPNVIDIYELLLKRKQVILYGVPGIGKSFYSTQLSNFFDNATVVQFHQNTTYEEFVFGETIKNGSIIPKIGSFLSKCIEATQNPDKKYLFIIDEINRGNLSKIFGEIIMALDREYTVTFTKDSELDIKSISIPKNLFILGTMNSLDKSIASIDFAIRRRFSFVKLYPNHKILEDISVTSDLRVDMSKLMETINSNILKVTGDEDLLLGHSYFMPNYLKQPDGTYLWDKHSLKCLFNYDILPLLETFLYKDSDDVSRIVGDKIPKRILSDEEFLDALILAFPEIRY